MQSCVWTDPTEFLKDTTTSREMVISMEEIPTDLVEDDEYDQKQKPIPDTKQDAEEPGANLATSQRLTATLFASLPRPKRKKAEAPENPFFAYSRKQLAQHLQKETPRLVSEMHVVAPTIPPEEAEARFDEWRQSLW